MKFLQLYLLLFFVFIFSQSPGDVKVKDQLGSENLNVSYSKDLDAKGCLSLHVQYPVLKSTSSYEVA